MSKTKEKYDDWLLIVPIARLEITDTFKKEFQVNRVTFVDRTKISGIRKRLGLPVLFSELTKNPLNKDFFKRPKTFAFIKFKGNPEDKKRECIEIIKKELNILSLSLLGYKTRVSGRQIGLYLNELKSTERTFVINRQKWDANLEFSSTEKLLPFRLDNNWKRFHKDFFFFKLLKLFSSDLKISQDWRNNILRAAEMIGKSINSRDIEYCFLWNMIVVEMLLTKQGDKYSDVLIERIGAFLGWAGYWTEDDFPTIIRELYMKRCQFVHDGNAGNITIKDLLFSDDLVFNLMLNIVCHIDLFKKKDDLIEFANKVKAEKLLGLSSNVQPKTLRILYREYTDEDYKKI